MLTRLHVTGFKNLVDVDVHFGPFTCVVGANGVGKSNLFDAIQFLSALADKSFVDAACSVRDEAGQTGDIQSIFHRFADIHEDQLRFVAEMIVPATGVDHLGQEAQAQATFLRYTLHLKHRPASPAQLAGGIELIEERLSSVAKRDVDELLLFPHSDAWKNSAVVFREANPRKRDYISTGPGGSGPLVYLHADGSSHKKTARSAAQLPRTVLSDTNATESPTAFLTRREMRSWQLLQLEPTALREPDKFVAPTRVSAAGAHMPATLFRLARGAERSNAPGGNVYSQVADRLQELIPDIREIEVDRNDTQQTLSVVAVDERGTRLPARSLSDGTLRFLALSVLQEDPEAVGVICFEEPENGIHPDRVPAILSLLRAIAVDPDLPVEAGNPLRQVIVNTHSPKVVTELDDDEMLGALKRGLGRADQGSGRVSFCALPDTWRRKLRPPPAELPLGELMAYLTGPAPLAAPADAPHTGNGVAARPPRVRRVIDRPDVQTLFDFETDDA